MLVFRAAEMNWLNCLRARLKSGISVVVCDRKRVNRIPRLTIGSSGVV